MDTPKQGFFLCPLNGLKKGDTILLEAELISAYRRAKVLSFQYLKNNIQLRIFYHDEDGKQNSFVGNEFDTVYVEHPEM
jgi:hypothetical protein